jgi:hypothetical protein
MKQICLWILLLCPVHVLHAQDGKLSRTGMVWPGKQAFPYFPGTPDGFRIEDPSLMPGGKVMLTVLQGLIILRAA